MSRFLPVFFSLDEDIQINANTAGDQTNPAIASDGLGFQIGWTSVHAGPVPDIYTRFLEISGEVEPDPEIPLVVTGYEIEGRDNVTGTQLNDGAFIAVFEEDYVYPEGDVSADITGAIFPEDAPPFLIYPAFERDTDELEPAVAPFGTENYLLGLTFVSAAAPEPEALVLTRDQDGNFLDLFFLQVSDEGFSYGVDLAELQDGSVVTVWLEDLDGLGMGVVVNGAQFEQAAGTGQIDVRAGPILIDDGGIATEAVVAALQGGGFVVGWVVDGDAFVQLYDAAFATVGPARELGADTAEDQANLDLVGMPDGGFVAAWDEVQGGEGGNILAQRFSSDGVPIEAPVVPTGTVAGEQRKPALAVDAFGTLALVWEDGQADGDGTGIFARTFFGQSFGTQGADAMEGSAIPEFLIGLAGDDLIQGRGGPDVLIGCGGADTLEGMRGPDLLEGGAGNDLLLGGSGVDALYGGRGADQIEGGDGNDLILGGRSGDTILGNAGADSLDGELGDDSLRGGNGADTMRGGEGDDTLKGGAGADLLEGNRGNDELRGGGGSDTLDGGKWADTLTGGADADTFMLRKGAGRETITDFTEDEDVLSLDARLWDGALTAQEIVDTFAKTRDGIVVLDFGKDELVLEGVTDAGTIVDEIAIF